MVTAHTQTNPGAWSSFPVAIVHGVADKRIETGEVFETRPLGSLWNLPPGNKPKHRGTAFLPSLHHDHDAREHKAQRERGQFVALVGDIDKGDHPIDTVEAAVVELIGAGAYKLHSTANAVHGDMRWRIILPLVEPLGFADWRDGQEALFDFMRSQGIEMHGVTERAGQVSFLPNVPPTHDKTGQALRDENGRPLFYAARASDTEAPALDLTRGPIAEAIADLRRRRAEDDRLREQMRVEAERRRVSRPISDGESIIDAFNRGNSIADMLSSYRYEQSRKNPEDWKSPNQTSTSFATRIIGDKWISLSGSDTAAGIGSQCASGCYGDAYDLFVHYEHGGDQKAAWKALCANQQRERATFGQSQAHAANRPAPTPDNDEPANDDYGADRALPEDTPPPRQPARPIELQDFYAYMPTHNYIFAPTGEFWPAASVNSRIAPVPLVSADGSPIMSQKKGKEDEQVELAANAWLDQNRPVEQMTWAPGKLQVVRDRLISDGGWITRAGCNVFNLYRPPVEIPGDATKAGQWIEHVQLVYPDDADHIIKWLAHRVQRPAEKINHAIVMGGNQGVGKDTILEPVKVAIGPWNFQEVAPTNILGRFNGFLKSVIMRVSEARDLGDFDRFGFYDHMKTYTAAPPDVLRVDEKFRPEFSVFNVVGVIITTNHKTDGIYLPADDRRHYVAWSDLTRETFDAGYWSKLYDWYETGGIGHVVAYLRQLNLSGFDAKGPPPKTPAFWDIVSSNQAPEEAEMNDALETLGWPSAVTVAMVADYANESFREFLTDRRNSRRIPHRFEECGYAQVRNEGTKDGYFKVGSKRCPIYARKTLARRDQIAAAERLAYPGNR